MSDVAPKELIPQRHLINKLRTTSDEFERLRDAGIIPPPVGIFNGKNMWMSEVLDQIDVEHSFVLQSEAAKLTGIEINEFYILVRYGFLPKPMHKREGGSDRCYYSRKEALSLRVHLDEIQNLARMYYSDVASGRTAG